MEHYVTLERAISCPRASVAVAADTAAQVLTAAGYRRGLGFGPTQSYVRAYRPTWAVALAILLAVPTAGLALLLLMVRSKDYCNVVIEDGPYGVVALVSGRVPASLPAYLEAATGAYPDAPGGPGALLQQPPPMLLAPSGTGYQAPPPPQQSAILRPATPVPGEFPGPPQPPGYADPGANARPAEWAREQQPGLEQQPAPVAFRPPSRLAPSMPADDPGRNGAPVNGAPGAPGAPVNGAAANGAPVNGAARAPDDDPFASTSGRVPWAVAGGGRGGMPAPGGSQPPASQPADAQPQRGGARSQPGGLATAVGDSARDVGAYVLRVDNDEVLDLGPFCLLGREPVAREGDPPARFVRFEDSKLSVSKTHLAYGVDDNGLWVMDRNSTNGTTVIDPTGRRIPCAPGAREYVQVGFQVQIGQRRFTVEAPDDATG